MNIKRMLPTIITMAVGWIVLILYLLPGMAHIRMYWANVAVIIAAFAVFVGFANLLYVHTTRITNRQHGWLYSSITILAAVAVLAVALLDMAKAFSISGDAQQATAQGIAGPEMMGIYQFVIQPLLSSFTALLAFLLAFAAFQTLRLRRGLNAWLFLLGVGIVLAAQALPVLDSLTFIRTWFVNAIATAGLRGVLLGIGLGTVATMVRILWGIDRPVSD